MTIKGLSSFCRLSTYRRFCRSITILNLLRDFPGFSAHRTFIIVCPNLHAAFMDHVIAITTNY
uniref:Uncharacterized protein n=1 Tax=Acrobeloides nanus TaxID=290746 RepID=A0A914DD41_9BILA